MVGLSLTFLLLLLILSLFLFSWDSCYSWEACLLGCGWSNYKFFFLLDDLSIFFMFMLFVCGLLALFYVFHYFSGSPDSVKLAILVKLFLAVMVFLVLSGDPAVSLIFWEYLGLTSFFLILFYTKGVGLRASLVTLVSSRFGDVALFLIYGVLVKGFNEVVLLVGLMTSLVVLTKSASYPLVGWLMEAMRAPTPVSSLVHSSTLVAAGVWFVLRYDWCVSSEVLWVLFFLCVLSILVSGFCASFFSDLKKIVAFSTCKKMSWCLLFYVVGSYNLAVLQLVTHGVCKCFLFMVVGDLMSSSSSAQLVSGVFSGSYLSGFFKFVAPFLVFCLCGLPFLGVFFSKHIFLALGVFNLSFFFSAFIFLGLFLTSCYSARLFCMIFFHLYGISLGLVANYALTMFPVFLGVYVNWFVAGSLEETFLCGGSYALLFLLTQALGLLGGVFIYINGGLSGLLWLSGKIWGCESLMLSVYRWFNGVVKMSAFFLFRWESFVFSSLSRLEFPHMSQFYGHLSGVGWLCFGVLLTLVLWWLLL